MKKINNEHNKFGRIVRLTACIVFLYLLSLIIFEGLHAGHESFCHENDCPICLVLQVIHSAKILDNSSINSTITFKPLSFINLIILSALFFAPATLVKQKVKLVI
ncbi:MAG: hypothetical protein K6A89_04180 [Treponema sp.]|nr:hypothetical protein [Treponema sp.]